MDEVDLRLCQMLWKDPRIPYREIADKLSISIQAVHRRVKILMDMNVIRFFRANVSLGYLGAVPVNVTGRSEAESVEKVVGELGNNDSAAALPGGRFSYHFLPLSQCDFLLPHRCCSTRSPTHKQMRHETGIGGTRFKVLPILLLALSPPAKVMILDGRAIYGKTS